MYESSEDEAEQHDRILPNIFDKRLVEEEKEESNRSSLGKLHHETTLARRETLL